jgi:hypothetical protein
MFVVFMIILILSFFTPIAIAIKPQLFRTTRKKGLLVNLLVFIFALIAVNIFEPVGADKVPTTKIEVAKTEQNLIQEIQVLPIYSQVKKHKLYQKIYSINPTQQNKILVKQSSRASKVAQQFRLWDLPTHRRHRNFERIIKANLNNPSSYEHVKSTYKASDDFTYIIVTTVYRGTNAYNSTVTEWAKAKFDLDGNLLQVLSTSDE